MLLISTLTIIYLSNLYLFCTFIEICSAVNGNINFVLQIEEGTLPHSNGHGFPGLAGGFIFSIYGTFISVFLVKL